MSEEKTITLKVNGKKITREIVSTNQLLIDFLRDELGLTGTKEACGVGVCGLCTVWINGKTISSCILPTVCADRTDIYTAEGLQMLQGNTHIPSFAPDPRLWEIVQQAFVECEGMQCGICTPGQIMSALALLKENSKPSENEIKDYMAGNLCRCTGYQSIVEAIELAAERWERTNAPI